MKSETHIIGDGCSAMMLASRADELEGHNLTVVKPDGAPPKDQMLGFWNTPGAEICRNSCQSILVKLVHHHRFWRVQDVLRKACLPCNA